MIAREALVDGGGDLERGRACYGRRAWAEAHEALAAADRTAPLAGDDVERLAWSAALSGQVPAFLGAMERRYEERLAAGDEVGAARAAFWLGMRLQSLAERARGSGWLARAERLVEGKDCVERGYLLLPTARRHEQQGDYEAAAAVAAEAEAIGERFNEADLSAFGRVIRGAVLIRNGRIGTGLALLDEAMVAAISGTLSPTITGLTYCSAIAGCQSIYELDRGREWTSALATWCDAQPQLLVFAGKCRVHRSEILQLGGEWGEAIGEARRVVEWKGPVVDPEALGDALYQEAEIHRLRGELGQAEQAYRRASEVGRDPQPGLSLLWLAQGRGEAAAVALRRVLAATTRPLVRARFLPANIEILLALGAVEEAAAVARELEEIAARFATEVLGAMAAHARGAVEVAAGRADAALEPLRRAFLVWQQLGAPYLAARVRSLIARACDALGDGDTARLERELAREVFVRLGAAPDLAARDGAEENPAPGRAPGGLTARELQVLRLVATGKTNKVIAKELFLSEKTVDRHVSNIFVKVNVSSRAAATAYAYEHHLV